MKKKQLPIIVNCILIFILIFILKITNNINAQAALKHGQLVLTPRTNGQYSFGEVRGTNGPWVDILVDGGRGLKTVPPSTLFSPGQKLKVVSKSNNQYSCTLAPDQPHPNLFINCTEGHQLVLERLKTIKEQDSLPASKHESPAISKMDPVPYVKNLLKWFSKYSNQIKAGPNPNENYCGKSSEGIHNLDLPIPVKPIPGEADLNPRPITNKLCTSNEVITNKERINKILDESTFFQGDLHGDWFKFENNLQAAGVLNSKGEWKKGKKMIFGGDAIDRGPDSSKMFGKLLTLQKKAKKAGGNLDLLVGNHEWFLLSNDELSISKYLLPDLLKETRNDFSKAMEIKNQMQKELKEAIINGSFKFSAIDENGKLVVHAGLHPLLQKKLDSVCKDCSVYQKSEKINSILKEAVVKGVAEGIAGARLASDQDTELYHALVGVGSNRGGDRPYGGIFWMDQAEFDEASKNGIQNTIPQQVGHSVQERGANVRNNTVFCDVGQNDYYQRNGSESSGMCGTDKNGNVFFLNLGKYDKSAGRPTTPPSLKIIGKPC